LGYIYPALGRYVRGFIDIKNDPAAEIQKNYPAPKITQQAEPSIWVEKTTQHFLECSDCTLAGVV